MAGLNRTRTGYWLTLGMFVTFAAFGTAVATLMLAMSATGRVKGGVLLNGAVSVLVLIVVTSVYTWVGAAWAARNMVSPPTIVDLARGAEPAGEVERTVRRLARLSGGLLGVFLSGLLVLALISAIWRPWQAE